MGYQDEKELNKRILDDPEWRNMVYKANEDGMSTARMLGWVLLLMAGLTFLESIAVVVFYLRS